MNFFYHYDVVLMLKMGKTEEIWMKQKHLDRSIWLNLDWS